MVSKIIVGIVVLSLIPVVYPLIASYLSTVSPSDKASFDVVPPYILSVKPNEIGQNSNATISLHTINGSISKPTVLLSVIDPDGMIFSPKQMTVGEHLFPWNFTPDVSLREGVYDTILVDKQNTKIVASIKFNVTSTPSAFSKFNPPFYLPILITVLIPAIGLIFKYVMDERGKSDGRIDKKLAWVHANMKTYIDLSTASWFICEYITCIFRRDIKSYYYTEDMDKVDFDLNKIIRDDYTLKNLRGLLEAIKIYVKKFSAYEDSTNLIYFDDILTEEFTVRLHRRIGLEIGEIFGELQITDLIQDVKSFPNSAVSKDISHSKIIPKFEYKLFYWFFHPKKPWCEVNRYNKIIKCLQYPY